MPKPSVSARQARWSAHRADKVSAALRNVMESTCSELHAQLAFLWIGFVVTTFVFGYTVVLILRTRSRGGKSVSARSASLGRGGLTGQIGETTYRNFNTVMHTHDDPFQDPVGAAPGPSVGVPSPGRATRA